MAKKLLHHKCCPSSKSTKAVIADAILKAGKQTKISSFFCSTASTDSSGSPARKKAKPTASATTEESSEDNCTSPSADEPCAGLRGEVIVGASLAPTAHPSALSLPLESSKQPSRSAKTKQPVVYCESNLESEDDSNEATDSDSDEFNLGQNIDEEDESIEGEDEEVLFASNLVDEDAEYEEEREKVAEYELCKLEKQLETLAVANFNTCNSIGLNSALEEKDNFVDTFIPFDKTALLTEAIKLFNALSLEEKERLNKRGKPRQPFYVFAVIDIEREFPGLSTDEIEHLDPDEIIAKVGILVKAWSKFYGDNSVKTLCGGSAKNIKN